MIVGLLFEGNQKLADIESYEGLIKVVKNLFDITEFKIQFGIVSFWLLPFFTFNFYFQTLVDTLLRSLTKISLSWLSGRLRMTENFSLSSIEYLKPLNQFLLHQNYDSLPIRHIYNSSQYFCRVSSQWLILSGVIGPQLLRGENIHQTEQGNSHASIVIWFKRKERWVL